MDQENDYVCQSKPYQADDKKLGVFPCHFRVLAAERPGTVQEVIGGGSQYKAAGISHVLLHLQPLLAGVGYAKVYKDARKTDDTKFDEFDQECP